MFRIVLLCASLCPLLAQESKLPVLQILQEIAAKAEAAKEYSFEGELQVTGQKGSAQMRILSQAKVRLAVGPEGKYLLRVAPLDKDEYLQVSNGQKTWAYVPKLKQYTEEESAAVGGDEDQDSEGSADSERDLAETFARQVIHILSVMHKTAEAVAPGPKPAEVKYEKKKQTWPVVRAVSTPEPDGSRSMTELAVDPATLHIGRLAWVNMSTTDGEKSILRMIVEFTTFQMGDTLPESTFTFEPPKNAKLVDAVPIPGQTGSFLLNRPAPDFELKNLDGERMRLADLRGRPVIVTFWASWCGPCRRELPELAKLHKEMKDQVVILGINDEGKSTARKFVEKAGLEFPVLDDSGLKAHRLYRIRSIPALFLIDADGKVVRFLKGAHGYPELRAALKTVGL